MVESASSEEEDKEDAEEDEDKKLDPVLKAEAYRKTMARKEHLCTKNGPFNPTTKKSASLASYNDATTARLIVKNLYSEHPLFNSFDFYLKQIRNMLTESAIQVRTKALKCMARVVQEDPSMLVRDDMQRGVDYSSLDTATRVRKAAVDLVGKLILHRAKLNDKYYERLLLRILDTGVSVRKCDQEP